MRLQSNLDCSISLWIERIEKKLIEITNKFKKQKTIETIHDWVEKKKTGIIKQTNENITREWGGGETNKNRCRFLSDRKRSVLCGCVLITFV